MSKYESHSISVSAPSGIPVIVSASGSLPSEGAGVVTLISSLPTKAVVVFFFSSSLPHPTTLKQQATNSMTAKLYQDLLVNPNKRLTIETELTQLSTGQTESVTIGGITFDSIPLQAMSKGELVNKELSFRWMPSQSSITQLIN